MLLLIHTAAYLLQLGPVGAHLLLDAARLLPHLLDDPIDARQAQQVLLLLAGYQVAVVLDYCLDALAQVLDFVGNGHHLQLRLQAGAGLY